MIPEKRLSRGTLLGFTLTELLVVIAIVAILASILLGSVGGTKERGHRVACQNQLHQFYIGIHLYSSDFGEKLPSINDSFSNDEHIPIMPVKIRNALVRYTSGSRVMDCPSFGKPFGTNWEFPDYGYVIGYNYLGGKHRTPWSPIFKLTNTWISPQTMTDNPQSILLTDMNDWSPGSLNSFAPHTRNGAIIKGTNFSNTLAKSATPPEIGAIGGNSCTLDGAVQWKSIKRMLMYNGSTAWGEGGCYAMW